MKSIIHKNVPSNELADCGFKDSALGNDDSLFLFYNSNRIYAYIYIYVYSAEMSIQEAWYMEDVEHTVSRTVEKCSA